MKTMNVRFPESFPLIELIKFASSHGLDVRLRQDGDLILKDPEVTAKTEGNVIQFRGKQA